MHRLFLAGATLWAVLAAGCAQVPHQSDGSARPIRDTAKSVAILVSAHPDDEMQMWSLLEADREAWPIFVFMNRGESTAACNNKSSVIGEFETVTLEPGELGPNPVPADNYTPACSEARINSTLKFLTLMSQADPHFPGQWVSKTIDEIPDWSTEWCKNNPDKSQCLPVDHKPLVWIDAQYRGAAVFYDAGDYDVTPQEVAWAVGQLIERRQSWGLSWAPISVLASNYTNGRGECIIYDHPDHDAVQQGLALLVEQEDDLDEEMLALATCSSDPNITRRYRLSDLAMRAAFGAKEDDPEHEKSGHTDDAGADTIAGNVDGAHGLAYGWLWPGHFPLGRKGQVALFHADQTFATKPGDLRPAPTEVIEIPSPIPSSSEDPFGKDTPAVASPEGLATSTPVPDESTPPPTDQPEPSNADQPAQAPTTSDG
ncbi:hypothetical protein [Stomatohabitans albus]|uniref:hypothetical protein n=1 Tax=Stomatohabitans albus TaxID=3110766 RepID=UPI00300D195C